MINLSGTSILTYTDCMKKIQELSRVYFGTNDLKLVHGFPQGTDPADLPTPMVTYTLVSKKPGLIGKKTQELKPRLRGEVRVEVINKATNEPETVTVELLGQMFDYIVQFDIWEADPLRADLALEEFERFIKQYTGYLKKEGVGEIIYEEAEEDNNSAWGTDLNHRKVRYKITIDTIMGVRVGSIKEIHLGIKLYPSTDELYLALLDTEHYTTNSPHDEVMIITEEDSESESE